MAKSYCCVFLFSSLAFLVTLFGVGATPILLGGKTLKIGIPIKTEFKEFVEVKLNSTNQAIQNQVKGYSIDVFFAAVSYLERHSLNVSYEFEAFVNREGNIAGTYDDLLHQIPEKAFPLGSNLTSYFSRAILNVTESPTMDKIEEKYFGNNHDDLQDQFNQISSETPSLTAQSFAGPFIITGSLVLLALLASESHIWKRPVMLAKTFSKKYLFYKSYKKANPSENGLAIGGDAGSTNQGNNYRKRLPMSLSFPA
ncbi:hypothetical protein L6164_002641 [Bauhinia variegata]|uniref:Uncharacterized protein n=1 Tax=Bauhinia variegata TaxID=167791 RepID=A0ACB9PYA1_BAUVA|nr:hypothetical protein L6164_002641 [Bauhinia variegata]